MKYVFSMLLVVFFGIGISIGQINYPKGAYMSIVEVRTKLPSQDHELKVIERSGGDIAMMGGNDYKLESEDKSVSKRTIKRMIYAYSDGENLYLNCLPYGCQQWYGQVTMIDEAKFQFIGGISGLAASTAAVMGGAVGGAIAASQRYLYEVDLKSGKLSLVEKIKK